MIKRWMFLVVLVACAVVFALAFLNASGESGTVGAPVQVPATGEDGVDSGIESPFPTATAPVPQSTTITSSITVTQPDPPPSARPATVRRLADGDSFDIVWSDTGEWDEVRLYGVNAPEGGACFGDEAKQILASLIEDETILVEGVQRDEFGRVLADVWVNGQFVNLALVVSGAARPISGDGFYADEIAEAREYAESSLVGLWSPAYCGAGANTDVIIVDITFDAPGRDNENPNGEFIDIANVGANDISMADWSIRDESTRHRFRFPDSFLLEAGAGVRVFSGCGNDTRDELYWCDADPVWNNGGDTGFLVDPNGNFADTFAYAG